MKNVISERIKALENYSPEDTIDSKNLDEFWTLNINRFKNKPLNLKILETNTPFSLIEAFHCMFEGFDETPLFGWFLIPKFPVQERYPCAVIFHGYSGSKGLPEKHAALLMMGIAVFAVDIRGQGGETGNHLKSPHGMTAGWVTQGILEKESSYFNAISIDALKAVEASVTMAKINKDEIFVMGDSQGGGLALLTAALCEIPRFAIANIPNMCHMDYGLMESKGSLKEIASFLNKFPNQTDRVVETLSYFDVMNMADRITIPILLSAGLKDEICLPETVYAAYNKIHSEKKINCFPFSGHEVSDYQKREGLLFIKKELGK
ncbi:acetylxylan esterase [Metabacillus sp. RGM 3146]|uniref:acetylxylan esterase n=1 Tax=Metabacillus sp. RGM 3146 TaxID=3401092 RepID=UPI003B9AD1CE